MPFKSGTNEDNDEIEFDTKRNQTDKGTKQFREIHDSDAMTSSSSEDEENSASNDATLDLESDTEDSNSDNATTPRQYPERLRRPRQFYDNIPWDAIKLQGGGNVGLPPST